MVGALLIDKPEGMTSHDVVNRLRRVLHIRRIGHAGTLDPFATGLLVMCIGGATRLVQFLLHLDKEYAATVRLGFATDTQDITGKQIGPLLSSNAVSLDDVSRVLNEFKGPLLQMPPMFSAKKVAGERLYRAAREGREVERKPVQITVHAIDLVGALSKEADGTSSFTLRVKCSSGTYVRTLANDIGERLGIGAHLSALRRTEVGGFNLAKALTLDELEQQREHGTLGDRFILPSEMLSHLPAVKLDSRGVESIRHGRSLRLNLVNDGEPVRICDLNNRLVAVGDYDAAAEMVRPRIVLAEND
jgi:tRNA pseudouridine55 synthase